MLVTSFWSIWYPFPLDLECFFFRPRMTFTNSNWFGNFSLDKFWSSKVRPKIGWFSEYGSTYVFGVLEVESMAKMSKKSYKWKENMLTNLLNSVSRIWNYRNINKQDKTQQEFFNTQPRFERTRQLRDKNKRDFFKVVMTIRFITNSAYLLKI